MNLTISMRPLAEGGTEYTATCSGLANDKDVDFIYEQQRAVNRIFNVLVNGRRALVRRKFETTFEKDHFSGEVFVKMGFRIVVFPEKGDMIACLDAEELFKPEAKHDTKA